MENNTCPDCTETKKIIQEWVDKQGHDRCWYYPELFKQLVNIFKLSPKVEPKLPPREEFELGCKRYQKQEYENMNDKGFTVIEFFYSLAMISLIVGMLFIATHSILKLW